MAEHKTVYCDKCGWTEDVSGRNARALKREVNASADAHREWHRQQIAAATNLRSNIDRPSGEYKQPRPATRRTLLHAHFANSARYRGVEYNPDHVDRIADDWEKSDSS